MDWEGLKTAYLDRERARLGLPSRADLETKRLEQERAAAAAAAALETQSTNQEFNRARIAAMPAEADLKRRLTEAQIANYAETTQPRADQTETQILANGNIGIVNRTTGDVRDTGVKAQVKPAASGGSGNEPRTGWTKLFGPDGKLIGFSHPAAGFKSLKDLNIPEGTKDAAPTGSEREALALGNVPIRAGDTMRRALAAVREAEKANPTDPSSWTGPIAGRVGNAYRGAVDSSGPGGDFDQARREGRSLVYALSGKQINQSEQAWLDQILPNLRDPGVDQQLERFDRFVNYLREAKRQGYTDPFAVAQSQLDAQLPSEAAARGGVTPSASHGGPGTADPLEGRTATNAAGQKIIRKGGRWVPLQ